MGKMLDRLGEWLWVAWLICIAASAVLLLLPPALGPVSWFIGLALTALMGAVLFDYLYRRTRISDGPHEAEWANRTRTKRDWLLICLSLLSVALMFTARSFDPGTDLVLPLAASVLIPAMLRLRGEAVAFLTSRQMAS